MWSLTRRVKRVSTPSRRVSPSRWGTVTGALTALYTQIWGMQLHGSADPALVRRLARIPYLDRQQWPHSLRRFVQLVRPLLEEEGRGRQPEPPALGHHSLELLTGRSDPGLAGICAAGAGYRAVLRCRAGFCQELAALGYGKEAGKGIRAAGGCGGAVLHATGAELSPAGAGRADGTQWGARTL